VPRVWSWAYRRDNARVRPGEPAPGGLHRRRARSRRRGPGSPRARPVRSDLRDGGLPRRPTAADRAARSAWSADRARPGRQRQRLTLLEKTVDGVRRRIIADVLYVSLQDGTALTAIRATELSHPGPRRRAGVVPGHVAARRSRHFIHERRESRPARPHGDSGTIRACRERARVVCRSMPLAASQGMHRWAAKPWSSALTRRVDAAELAHGRVEPLGLLEVADVTRVGDHNELRVRDRLLELVCDA
jgi:hypothetical protein